MRRFSVKSFIYLYLINVSFSEFDENRVTQKMKDFVAYSMSEKDCKEVFRIYLLVKSEADDQIIYKEKSLYDEAYHAICLLMTTGTVSKISDFEQVLSNVNKHIHERFRNKFRKQSPVPGKKLCVFLIRKLKKHNVLGVIC